MKVVLDSSELFPSEMLDEMIEDYLSSEDSSDIWFTAEMEGTPISIGYCAPEKLTEGTFNLYAIAVDKQLQGKGVGAQMIGYIEQKLAAKGHRLLLVETSGTDEYALTRAFYHKLGYEPKAVIPDFYSEGDDKVVFWKKLKA